MQCPRWNVYVPGRVEGVRLPDAQGKDVVFSYPSPQGSTNITEGINESLDGRTAEDQSIKPPWKQILIVQEHKARGAPEDTITNSRTTLPRADFTLAHPRCLSAWSEGEIFEIWNVRKQSQERPYAEESTFNEFLDSKSLDSDFLFLQKEIPSFISPSVSVRLTSQRDCSWLRGISVRGCGCLILAS